MLPNKGDIIVFVVVVENKCFGVLEIICFAFLGFAIFNLID